MKDYTKKQKILIILGVSLFILIGSGLTYAALTWATSNPINIGLTSGCFEINYTPGGAINNANVEVMNESTLISNNKFTITEGIALTYANIGIKSTCTIEGYGSLYLNVTSLSSAFTTGSSKGSLKYAILNNTSSSTTLTVAGLKGQSFDIVKKGIITSTGTINILNKKLSNTSQNKYLIVFYIDGSRIGNDVVGASFAGNISADAHQGRINADITLNNLNKFNNTITLANDTPDFTTVSGNNGKDNNGNTGLGDGTKGIYKAEDDFGTSYYFRGAVENNYVKFGKYKSDYEDIAQAGDDMYWRIIRINGDGSIRMIYAGTSAYANGDTNQDSYIGYSEYNTNYQDNGYVGYMYGNFTTPTNCNTDNSTDITTCTGGSTSYEEAHANINDSNIKTFIDNWYNNNLKDYAYAIEDTIYCNDRSIAPVDNYAGFTFTKTGKGIENTAYSNALRNYAEHTPSLKCVNKNDRFTVNNSIGNAKLTNPIALISTDEAYMAGAFTYNFIDDSYITNTDFYLYSGDWYWTLTPFAAAGGRAYVVSVHNDGRLVSNFVDDAYGVRPVVSLSSDAISGGRGTMDDPWIVG